MLYVFFLFAFSRAEDLDREALASMAEATAKLEAVNPTVSASGKHPPCPPQVNALSPYLRSQCPKTETFATKAYPIQNIPGAGDQALPVSVVSEGEVARIFKQVSDLGLPWGSSRLCVQRGLIMGFCLEQAMKVHVAKIIAQPSVLGKAMMSNCKSKNSSPGTIWPVHQAVLLKVKTKDGSLKDYVIDPSTMDEAAPKEKWLGCLANVGSVSIGAPNAINWQEATMSDPPAFNVDKFHDIDVNWRMYPHP